jgi:hypothetical protein
MVTTVTHLSYRELEMYTCVAAVQRQTVERVFM